MGIGTDPIEYLDKEMQFGFGDETDMLNIMTCINTRRANGSYDSSKAGAEEGKDGGSERGSGDKSRKRHNKYKDCPSLLEEAGVLTGKGRGSAGGGVSNGLGGGEGSADIEEGE